MLFPQTWRQLCDSGSGVLRDPLGGCPNRARPVLCGGSAVNARPDVALRNGRMIKPGKLRPYTLLDGHEALHATVYLFVLGVHNECLFVSASEA